MLTLFIRLFESESGSAAAEYAMILALVGSGLAAACFALSNSISSTVNAAVGFLQSVNL